jgi:hypothetical protein
MAAKKRATAADGPMAVDALLAAAAHPLTKEIELVRKWTRTAALGITEGVKWNAPSFARGEWFATVHMRSMAEVRVVLHFGAKAKGIQADRERIPDPEGLLRWLAADRAIASLGAGAALRKRKAAWQAIVRAWGE